MLARATVEARIALCEVASAAEEAAARARSLAELLDEALVALTAGESTTTPELEPRRYRTKFYAAPLPEGQSASDVSGETDLAEWSTPRAALTAAREQRLALMPPTFSILLELAELGTLGAVAAAAEARIITPVLPRVVRRGDRWEFVYPTGGAGG